MREDKYKEIVKHHHRYDIIGGLRVFFCLTFEHAYATKQNFDFCPSCGECVREIKELVS